MENQWNRTLTADEEELVRSMVSMRHGSSSINMLWTSWLLATLDEARRERDAAVAAERERCAKICQATSDANDGFATLTGKTNSAREAHIEIARVAQRMAEIIRSGT